MIDDESVRLFLLTAEKNPFVIGAKGLAALSAGGFGAGSIIFEVLVRKADELTPGDRSRVYELPPDDGGQDQAKRLLERAQEKGLALLELNPSCGASCVL